MQESRIVMFLLHFVLKEASVTRWVKLAEARCADDSPSVLQHFQAHAQWRLFERINWERTFARRGLAFSHYKLWGQATLNPERQVVFTYGEHGNDSVRQVFVQPLDSKGPVRGDVLVCEQQEWCVPLFDRGHLIVDESAHPELTQALAAHFASDPWSADIEEVHRLIHEGLSERVPDFERHFVDCWNQEGPSLLHLGPLSIM